jgi:prevent-host-death family protein
MTEIGVRELKARASQIIRSLRERHAGYLITHRGHPVGMLLPLEEARAVSSAPMVESGTAVWEELTRLGEEIGRGWCSPLTSTELLSSMRR